MKDCQEVTLDIERSAFERLSLMDRTGLRLHLAICKECRKYFKDSIVIDKLLKKKFRHLGDYSFTPQEKEVLKQKITR